MNKTQDVAAARWAIGYNTNSHSPRARRWYHIARVVYADGGWFELYWHDDQSLRGDNRVVIRRKAKEMGLDPLPGMFRLWRDPKRRGGEMERVL